MEDEIILKPFSDDDEPEDDELEDDAPEPDDDLPDDIPVEEEVN